MLSIIIINKNSTEIAPTYTTKKRRAKNSTPSIINKPDTLKNTRTKNKTECIGFFEVTTSIPHIIVKQEKKINKIVSIK
jgi:hypothetical protein